MPPPCWLCQILLVLSLALSSVLGRNIGDGEYKKGRGENSDIGTTLEYILREDYGEISLENIRTELTRLKAKMDDLEDMEKRLEEVLVDKDEKDSLGARLLDYDYQGDAPQPSEAEEKVTGVSSNGNISFPLLVPNRSADDPTMMKELRESAGVPLAYNRSKELRLNAIRSTILELRNGNTSNNTNRGNTTLELAKTWESIFRNGDAMPKTSFVAYTEKLQSFYPSCEIPRHTKDEVWTDSNGMNILFDLTYPTPEEGTNLNIVAAKLRLYKKNQVYTNKTQSAHVAVETNSSSSRSARTEKPHHSSQSMTRDRAYDDERRIRVSVYWYTRNVKRNRVKKKLVDSQMFSLGGENQWIEFNIRTAVRAWRENEWNHGLVVTVDDEDGVMLPAERYLHAMNCSEGVESSRPIPSVIVDAAKQYMMQQQENNQSTAAANPFPDYLYPKLDICTVEVPLGDNRTVPDSACLMRKGSDEIPNNMFTYRNETTPKPTASRRPENESRGTYFSVVGLGSPVSNSNRNSLVPILTKSDIVSAPEDVRMKNELLRAQTEAPRLRHSRKHTPTTKDDGN